MRPGLNRSRLKHFFAFSVVLIHIIIPAVSDYSKEPTVSSSQSQLLSLAFESETKQVFIINPNLLILFFFFFLGGGVGGSLGASVVLVTQKI